MKNIDRPPLHGEEVAKAEAMPSPEQAGPLNDDVVERILSRNKEAKQFLAVQMAALGLTEKNINRVLNMDSTTKKETT